MFLSRTFLVSWFLLGTHLNPLAELFYCLIICILDSLLYLSLHGDNQSSHHTGSTSDYTIPSTLRGDHLRLLAPGTLHPTYHSSCMKSTACLQRIFFCRWMVSSSW